MEADDDEVPARKTGNYSTGTASVTGAGTNRITDNRNSNASASSTSSGSSTGAGIPIAASVSITPESVWPYPDNAIASTHPDRKDQSFRLYPKNTLIKGPVKTGKFHQAIMTAVGIIEGKDSNMMNIEPVPDVLEHYQQYVDEGRILHIS